jgi:hypothetical protein
MRAPLLTSLVAVLVASTAAAQFRQVELSRDDVIAIYGIPVKERPAFEYEWKFDAPTFCRLVVERRQAGQHDWKAVQSDADEKNSATRICLTVLFDARPEARGPADSLVIPMQWAWENRITGISGKITRDAVLDGPIGSITSWKRDADPNEILYFKTKIGEYRIRIEKLLRQ